MARPEPSGERRPYSTFTPTLLMTFAHIAFSACMILASSADVLPTVSEPEAITVSFTSGIAMTFTASSWSRAMIFAGVFAGAKNRPNRPRRSLARRTR